jgi:hypothetical protein
MDSHVGSRYKRARVIFDGWVSEYDDVIYLYTAVPDGTSYESYGNTQAGSVRPKTPNLMLTIDYASVRRVSPLRDRYRDPDSPDYAYGKDEDHDKS